MLGVVSQQCCVRLHKVKSLTGFKLCATTFNNMQQGVQTDATCNIEQCWELLVNNVASLEVLELVALFLLKTETCDAKDIDAMFCLVNVGFEKRGSNTK